MKAPTIQARLSSCILHPKYQRGCAACKIQNGRYYRWYRRVTGTAKCDYTPCNPWVDCPVCYPN